jgi:hypothetical protein
MSDAGIFSFSSMSDCIVIDVTCRSARPNSSKADDSPTMSPNGDSMLVPSTSGLQPWAA